MSVVEVAGTGSQTLLCPLVNWVLVVSLELLMSFGSVFLNQTFRVTDTLAEGLRDETKILAFPQMILVSSNHCIYFQYFKMICLVSTKCRIKAMFHWKHCFLICSQSGRCLPGWVQLHAPPPSCRRHGAFTIGNENVALLLWLRGKELNVMNWMWMTSIGL